MGILGTIPEVTGSIHRALCTYNIRHTDMGPLTQGEQPDLRAWDSAGWFLKGRGFWSRYIK